MRIGYDAADLSSGNPSSDKGMTPMMKQYLEIKASVPDCILFFRLGDFYEMFDKDALEAAEILGIVLTARSKGDEKIPMCGIPFHSSTGYIAKLTRAGRKVAVCEQTSDPKLPGIVTREVVRIITPGTTLDENVLDEKTSNYLAAICGISMVLTELSTGEITMLNLKNDEEMLGEIQKYKPREIIYDGADTPIRNVLQKHFPGIYWHEEKLSDDFGNKLEAHFGGDALRDMNLDNEGLKALGLIIGFLENTQKTKVGEGAALAHLKEVRVLSKSAIMNLDESTIRNLEILENAREKKVEGSLLGVLDKTVTNAGGRLLKRVLVEPLAELSAIEERHAIIEFLLKKQNVLLDLRGALKGVMDVERMLGRLTLGSGNARDLRALVNSYKAIADVRRMLEREGGIVWEMIGMRINLLPELMLGLDAALVEAPPHLTRDGGMIADGYNAELDQYKSLSRDGKSFIQALQTREIARTGINSLKVKFNKVFGYYIEISNANLSQAPADYTRKQTLANAERFSTPELKEYEEKVLGAEEKIVEIEAGIFENLRALVLEATVEIKKGAAAIAYLDVMMDFALVSWENNYVRPLVVGTDLAAGNDDDGIAISDLRIEKGRHPVIEKLNPQDLFVPNDTFLTENERMILITGPNMGGKSTFLRQTALIVLMAHLGMYVPAASAVIPLVDRIFTRVGASDNLVKGQSTFWLEMEETALILRQATARSLVILDEIGRGTSTFDGVSIAWGIMEYLHNTVKAKTLFASHYHELIKLADSLPKAANFSVKVLEKDGDSVVFLYKIGRGGVDKSYGIEVARLAGLPDEVIARAKEILVDLEKESIGTGQESFGFEVEVGDRSHQRLEVVREPYSPALDALRALDANTMTPLEALNKLNDLKKLL